MWIRILIHLISPQCFREQLLVGSYRTCDAQNGQLISDFLGLLTTLTAPLTMIHLEGMLETDVNFMISDRLNLPPR